MKPHHIEWGAKLLMAQTWLPALALTVEPKGTQFSLQVAWLRYPCSQPSHTSLPRLLITRAPGGYLWAGTPWKSLGPKSPKRGQIRTLSWEHAGWIEKTPGSSPHQAHCPSSVDAPRRGVRVPGYSMPSDADGSPSWGLSSLQTFGTHTESASG